jgi:hypothetical protein
MATREDKCAVKRCRGNPAMFYLGHHICDGCWNEFCEKTEEEFLKKVESQAKKEDVGG